MKAHEFLDIVAPFKDKVFRLAKRLLVSTEEAEDVTQEVMVKLWDKQDRIINYSNVEAYAMTMTKNYCLDQLKSKRSSNLNIVDAKIEDKNNLIEQKIENIDSLQWVEKIMNNLPEQQKMIVQLRDVECYDFDEISEIMDINPSAIRTALSRARKTIREEMTKIHNHGIR